MPCSSLRKRRSNPSFDRPNSSISAQLPAPHKTAANATKITSSSSWLALLARGSGKRPNAFLNFFIQRPPNQGAVFRILLAFQCNSPAEPICDSPALAGEGWGGGLSTQGFPKRRKPPPAPSARPPPQAGE